MQPSAISLTAVSSLGDMNFILDYFSDTDGIILDVRGNGGGLVEMPINLPPTSSKKRHL